MQAVQQDEPLRDPHLRGGGREDEARREDKHLPADHGKYERPATEDCVFTLHRAVRGASRVNGTDHVHQTEIEHRQQDGRGSVLFDNDRGHVPSVQPTSMLTCAMRNSTSSRSTRHFSRSNDSCIIFLSFHLS